MSIVITEFNSRKNPVGEVKEFSWPVFKKRLRSAVVTPESCDEYASMTNEQRTNVKDVGGFVGGELVNGRRSKSLLKNRTIVTIDADDAKGDDVDAYELLHDYVYFVHSTHTSSPDKPRLRWVFPLARPVTPDEYRKLARVFADMVGLDTVDESTDQPERLMFWPSVSFDGDYQTWEGGTVTADPDKLLAEIEDEPPALPSTPSSSSSSDEPRVAEVHEGGRNKQVFGYASMLRGAGLDYDALAFAVADYNERYCVPPLPPFEIRTICQSVCGRYEAGTNVMDTMRDAYDDFCDMGKLEKAEVPTKRKKIVLESASDLAARNVEPPKFFVDGLITTGITILASPPKFGKSWWCTDFCQCIALGQDFMGMKTTKTKVIYLALEDGAYRLKDRGAKVAGTRQIPSDLYLALEAPQLQDGLIDELKAQIDALGGDVGVIVIDTLQKVRGVAGKTEGVYGYDYRELGELHKFAINNNIAVVLVHHLNKGGDDSDFVARLNGSTGISGAADTIITMTRSSRGDKDTKMAITGRDVKERTLVLQMNWNTWRWENLGEEKDVRASEADSEYESDPIVRIVRAKLDEAEDLLEDTTYENDMVKWECTSAELAEAIHNRFGDNYDAELGSASQVGQKARRLADRLMSYDGISYQYGTERNARAHVFSRYIV